MPNHRTSDISVIVSGKWDCNVCGTVGNWASRARCRLCGAYGPKGSGGGGGKGGGKGGGGSQSRAGGQSTNLGGGARFGEGAGGAPTTLAQRQLQRQNDDLRLQRQREESKKREDALRAANQKLQRELSAAKAGAKTRDADEDDDMDEDEDTEEERQRKIEATQRAIPYLIIQYGEGSEQVAEAKTSIDNLLRAAREAKPYKTHRGQLERRLERLRKQQDKGREEEDDLLQEIESMQGRLNKLRAVNDERDKTIATIDEELKDLLRKAIDGEAADAAPVPPAGDPSVAWRTVNETLASMVAQPGVPQEWAAQLGGLLEQVRLAAIAIQCQSGMPPTGPPMAAACSGTSTSPSVAASSSTAASSASPITQPISLAQALPKADLAVAQPQQPECQPPPTTATTRQPTQLAAVSAEDMVARAMALSSTDATIQLRPHGGAATTNAKTNGDGSSANKPVASDTRAADIGPADVAGKDSDDVSDDEPQDTEDDTADMDVQVRDGESSEQHSTRIKRLLRERLQRDRTARGLHKAREELKNKSKDGKETKEKPRARVTLKK